MEIQKTMRGYVRPLPRLTEARQRAALLLCRVLYVESKTETLADLIATLRKGDVVAVVWLHVLAAPRTTYRDKPRDALWLAIEQIEAKGASIFEVETQRHTATKSERDGMIRDAIEHLTSAGRAAAGKRNGAKSKGRPAKVFAPEVIEAARIAWFDLRHRTNVVAVKAGPKGWSMSRYYKQFGQSGRPPGK
ncbi:MAG: hypothetical protein RL291_709 [Pseudomonadota bacterium]|jgi:hypothetical protein